MKPTIFNIYRPEQERLRLAILKEKAAYRDLWKKCNMDQPESADLDHFRSKTMAFGMSQLPVTRKRLYAYLDLINPFSDKELPDPLPLTVFSVEPAVMGVGVGTLPPAIEFDSGVYQMRGQIKLKPSERLLKVDLSKPRKQIVKEFEYFLDVVERWRERDKQIQVIKENYAKWNQDKSRNSEKTWQALEVWKLRREKTPFKDIARKLKMGEEAAKKAFYRAYELIEEKPYKKERMTKRAIPKSELKRICDTCPDRSTCRVPCPDALPYVIQDEVKLDPKHVFLPDIQF
jgi:hypothetical protein